MMGMKKAHSRALHASHGGGLNLTPMIDMMTIILVFLIKSYSVSPSYLTPTQEIRLSPTTSESVAPDRAVLIIGKDGILIEGQKVIAFQNGKASADFLKRDSVPELYKALKELHTRAQIKTPSGTLILQADRELSYSILKPILRTAGLAGFNDIKFAGQVED